MAHPHVIYKLPAARRKYNTRELSTTSEEGTDTCLVCYRIYCEKDDPSDIHEIACVPLQLQPCKHVIGSECFAKMVQADMDACQVCRAKIELLSNPVPAWLETASSWSWYRLFADYTPGHALKEEKLNTFNSLSKRLFDRKLLPGETFRMWWFYMDSLSAWTRVVLIFALIIRVTFALSEWVVGTPYVELEMLRVLGVRLPESRYLALWIDFPVMAMLFSVTVRRNAGGDGTVGWEPFTMLFLMARMFTLLISIRGFALMLALNWFLYAVITGLLIWYGIEGNNGR
ncbi:hypothetical protein DM02DRAFT_610755 [Periconia macrospinosa]|uniref:RING-type domain-containing protein n=1 Tax=Periconia macrospinosa TaxID=97972 RepID=A0A2V1E742_9PLEO|nr:hypothetical protein DM02DRAFT_610755 [Periconia macrospinosa]